MKKSKIFLLLILLGATLTASALMLDGKMRSAFLCAGVILLIAAAAVLLIRSNEKTPPVNPGYDYEAKKRLMTEPEQALYCILQRSGCAVYPQVSLAALVDKTSHGAYRNELFRTVDFVICDLRTSRPLLVVELNDASHKRSERVLRDEKVKYILTKAGLPLLTLTLEDLSDERQILRRIQREKR